MIVRCKSGLEGWRDRLQTVYDSYEEFVRYDALYGIAIRIGFKSTERAWNKNPLIEGSVNPSDLRRSKEKK